MSIIRSKLKTLLGFRPFFSRKSFLLKLVISNIVIGSILIAALSTMLFIQFSNNSIEEINKASINSLEQSVRAFDSLWSTTYSNMYGLFTTNGVVMDALIKTQFSPRDNGDIFRKLNEIVANNSIFTSIYAYNSAADMVFSTNGPPESRKSFFDQGIIASIEDSEITVSRFAYSAIVYRKMQYTYGMNEINKNVISVIFSDDDLRSALIFNIDQNVLQNLITPAKTGGSTSIMIMTNEGLIISDSKLDNIYTHISNENFVQKIILHKENNGYSLDYVDGRKSLVSFKRWDKWDNLRWTFVSIGNYEKLLSNVKQFQNRVLAITSFFMLLSIIIAALFIGNIYKPFYKLLGKTRVRSSDAGVNKLNEFDYLNNVYDSMANDLDNLTVYKNSSRETLKRELLNRILHGELISNSDMRKQVVDLNFQMNAERYIVVVLRLDSMQDVLKSYSNEDINLYRFAICNISEELFSEDFKVQVVDSGEDNISIIIYLYENDKDSTPQIINDIHKIQDACRQYLKLSITAGIGSREEGINGIQYSFKNAFETTGYRLIAGKGSVLEYIKLSSERTEDYKYPFDEEKCIIDALKSADQEKARTSLDAFLEGINRYSCDEILLALNQLTLLSFRTVKNLFDVNELIQSGIHFEYRISSNVLSSFDTLEEVKEYLLGYYTSIIEGIIKKKENKYKDIIDRIQEYVKENYYDANISIDALSDMVNLSPNYVRTLFKENTGKSLSGFINEIRFNKAKNYLIKSDYPANKIAEMVGFPGGGYFYTAFKKMSGITPDEFRKENKK